MKLPGEAWLQYEAKPLGPREALLTQSAFLAPKGLLGFLYWYGLYPFHGAIFSNMINKIAERAEARSVAAFRHNHLSVLSKIRR